MRCLSWARITAAPPTGRRSTASSMTDQILGGFCLACRAWRLEAQPDPALDLAGGRALAPGPGDGPRVVLGLEQAVHELDLEAADGRRGGLEPEVGLEPAGQDVAVLGPPVRCIGLPDEREELLQHALVGHAVQGEQVFDVTALEPDPAGLQPADLGPRRPDLEAGPLGRDPGGLAEPAQLAAEHHAQHRRLDRGVVQTGKRLLAIRHHSIHHRSDADGPALRVPASGPGSPKHIATRKALPIE